MTALTLTDAINAMPRAGLPRHRYWHRIVRDQTDIEMPPRGKRPNGYCIRQDEGREPQVGDLVVARSYAVTSRFQVRGGSHALFRVTDVGEEGLLVVPEIQTTTLGPVLRRALVLLPIGTSKDDGAHRATA